MARTVAIIQARMTSRRLPGKVLLPLKEYWQREPTPVIYHVLHRVSATDLDVIDEIAVAVPYGDAQQPLIDALAACPIPHVVVRGPEEDVLRRYVIAAEKTRAEVIVRVTADCPYVSPELIYAAIHLRGWHNLPFLDAVAFHGSEVEVFTREALLDADLWATDPYDREHVGPYMRRKYAVNMCIDTPDDYARLTA